MFSDSVGGYYGFEVVNHLNNLWKDNKAGLVFDSVYYASYSSNILRTASGSPQTVVSFINVDDAQGYMITNSLWVSQNAGDTCIKVQHGEAQHLDFGNLTGCSFIGSSETKILGLSPSEHPQWNIVANNGIDNDYILGRVNTGLAGSYVSPQEGLILIDTTLNIPIYYDGHTFRRFSDNTVLVADTLFWDDFRSGNFTDSSYVTVNDGVNDWCVGTDDSYDGTYNAYITDDGCTNATYNVNNSEVSHFYRDFTFPSGATDCSINMYWKCEGEVGYDFGRIYSSPTSYTPSAGSLPSATATQLSGELNNNNVWTKVGYDLGDLGGTSIRIIWTWRNDGSVGTDPPLQIDKVVVIYNQ